VRLTTSLQVGPKYFGCVVCRFHVAAGAGSAPCQKPVSINLQKWFLSPTGRLNFGFITEEKLTIVLITPPLGVPNWSSTTHQAILSSPLGDTLLPLFFLAPLPCLESCQRVRGYSTYRTPSGCRTSSPNTSSFAGLDPEGFMVRRMCASTMGYCTCGTMSVHRCCHTGVMALWRCYVKIFTTLRSATSSSSSMLVRERNPRVRSTRVRIRVYLNRYNITI
jgi:hypothetical protein